MQIKFCVGQGIYKYVNSDLVTSIELCGDTVQLHMMDLRGITVEGKLDDVAAKLNGETIKEPAKKRTARRKR